jgi:DNA-binding beta-propeller fold protein YncE
MHTRHWKFPACRSTVLDTVTDKVSKTIPIPEGPPQFVSFSNDGKTPYVSVYDTNGSAHLIVFIDTATGQVTGQVPVTNHAGSLAGQPERPVPLRAEPQQHDDERRHEGNERSGPGRH